jgi:AraC-like DNA-binding protein
MYTDTIGESVVFQLKNIEHLRFEKPEEFLNIISDFSRMYYICEGEGSIIPGNEIIKLEAGHVYLIPSFTPCTYYFSEGLCMYYIHFSAELRNGLKIYDLFEVKNVVSALNNLSDLFERLLEINPNLELPHHDPKIYQNKPWVNKKVVFKSAAHHIETIGILGQLFSRFMTNEKNISINELLKYNIQPILYYIQNNLKETISIDKLAEMSCYSKDHFTRIFKNLLGMPPCEFIIRKRIEKAQLLLLTTDMTQEQIVEEAGFHSASYFSRIFNKYMASTPAEYREQRG